MTDNAESKVREWARKRNGNPLETEDVVELVLAVDDDSDTRHGETLQRLDDVDERHITLCLRVSELEQVSVGCSERVRAFVAAEHDMRHAEHMSSYHAPDRRADDPPDSAFLEKRLSAFPEDAELSDIKRFWKSFKWVAIVFGSGVLIMLANQLGNIIFGGPM